MEGTDSFQTEHEFTLPCGFASEDGELHRIGRMRLATAADEILPMRDPRVQQNPAYLTVILLSRVITGLGGLNSITTHVVEGLFSKDFAFLQDLYNRINQAETSKIQAECPKCEHRFHMEDDALGEV